MNQTVQRVAFAMILSVSLAALLFLAAGLSQVQLSTTWRDFGAVEDAAQTAVKPAVDGLDLGDVSGTILQAMGLSIFIWAPLILVLILVSAEMRRALLKDLRRVIVFVVIFAAVYTLRDEFKRMLTGEWNMGEPAEMLPAVPEFIERPSALLLFGLTIVLLLLLVGGGWLLWRWLRPQNRLQLLAVDAQETLADLQAGADFHNTIIQHYYRMCRLLAEEKRIERASGMTPAEFARKLENLGLAGAEVQRLTRLFERVRYGGHDLNSADELEAMACLTAVAQAARYES